MLFSSFFSIRFCFNLLVVSDSFSSSCSICFSMSSIFWWKWSFTQLLSSCLLISAFNIFFKLWSSYSIYNSNSKEKKIFNNIFLKIKLFLYIKFWCYRPVGRAVTRSYLEREVWGSNFGPVKSGTVLPTRFATAVTFLRKELCCPGAMTRR